MWLEDPVPPDNIEAMARATHAISVPVCTGENLYGRPGPDVVEVGVVRDLLRFHEPARFRYVDVNPRARLHLDQLAESLWWG
jgi:hypothetical protein